VTAAAFGEGCPHPLFDPKTGARVLAKRVTSRGTGPAVCDTTRRRVMTRNGYDNLILMCAIHARVIDHRESVGQFRSSY
jgi:hypothetical protein